MSTRRCWRVLAIFVLALLILPPAGVGAASSENGAAVVALGERTITVGGVQVPSSMQRETVVVGGAGFTPGELIGLWATLPDYAVVSLDDDDITADVDGKFAVEIYLPESLPTGMQWYSARGQASGNGGIAAFYLQAGTGPATTAGTQVGFSPSTVKQEEVTELAGSGFMAGEVVSLWVTAPSGAVFSLGSILADSAGAFDTPFFVPAVALGRYYITAFGDTSHKAAIGSGIVEYGNGLSIPGAQLAVDIGRDKQRAFLEVVGKGFTSEETISFWLTAPDGSVLDYGSLKVGSDGVLDAVIYLGSYLPAGTYYLSVRGDQSGLSTFVKFNLDPGPHEPGKE